MEEMSDHSGMTRKWRRDWDAEWGGVKEVEWTGEKRLKVMG